MMKTLTIRTLMAAAAAAVVCTSVGWEAGVVSAQGTRGRLEANSAARLREAIEAGIREKQLPGAVVLVGRRDQVLFHEAFGHRAVVPALEPMTRDTIFDIASLTKVVATATATMILIERGQLRLDDAVVRHIPEFGKYGKAAISVRHLLAHVSGLRPDIDMAIEFEGAATAFQLAAEETLVARPGERFIYSDIGFFLLGEIVARVSGRPFEEFVHAEVFEPLGMRDTRFLPPADLHPRIAPTEACRPLGWPCGGPGAVMLRGLVHDPTARRMGGVAGHAGVFSTSADLSRYARMLLNGGTLDRQRILSPLGVAMMTREATSAVVGNARGLGWDMDSRFSANRGDLFPIGSFGHTGWTGTSLWVDPLTSSYVVFLSSRLHPDGKGDVTALRGRVSTMVAAALDDVRVPEHARIIGRDFGPRPAAPPVPAARPAGTVLTGVDVLQAEGFARLRGRRVGLVTNHTGRTRDGASTIDVIHGAPDVTLVALFSPEHGIRGILDEEHVPSSRDEQTGLLSTRSTAPRGGRPTRCCRGSTRW
jgi:CubicO group peptidase (beta-lactamase class C family)